MSESVTIETPATTADVEIARIEAERDVSVAQIAADTAVELAETEAETEEDELEWLVSHLEGLQANVDTRLNSLSNQATAMMEALSRLETMLTSLSILIPPSLTTEAETVTEAEIITPEVPDATIEKNTASDAVDLPARATVRWLR